MAIFEDREASFGNSRPVEIFKFFFGNEKYTYSGFDQEVTWQEDLYTRAAIKRGDMEGSANPEKGTIDLEMALPNSLVQQVLTVPPSMPVNLTIFRAQRDDLNDFRQVWVGRVRAHEVIGQVVHLHGISVLHQEYRLGNPLRYQKACPYSVYDEYNCTIDPLDFEYSTTATVVSASKVSSPNLVWSAAGIPTGLKEGWFVGGYVTYDDVVSNVVGKRVIIDYDHTNGIVTVFPALRGFISEASMKFYPGCRHDSYDCYHKFGNILNYGGDPILPLIDPYDPTVDEF